MEADERTFWFRRSRLWIRWYRRRATRFRLWRRRWGGLDREAGLQSSEERTALA